MDLLKNGGLGNSLALARAVRPLRTVVKHERRASTAMQPRCYPRNPFRVHKVRWQKIQKDPGVLESNHPESCNLEGVFYPQKGFKRPRKKEFCNVKVISHKRPPEIPKTLKSAAGFPPIEALLSLLQSEPFTAVPCAANRSSDEKSSLLQTMGTAVHVYICLPRFSLGYQKFV